MNAFARIDLYFVEKGEKRLGKISKIKSNIFIGIGIFSNFEINGTVKGYEEIETIIGG